jgi:hypothetical protein
MKGQSALEFMTTYGWALLTILFVAVAAYYFLSLKPTNASCDFGTSVSCNSYQFFRKNDGTMRLRMMLVNGMGRVISFWAPAATSSGYVLMNQTLTVSNIGKNGVNTYTGTCTGPALFVKNGDLISCNFDIPDTTSMPEVGKFAKFDVAVYYTACETDPLYPVRCNGDNRTLHGSVVTPFEAGINYSTSPSGYYCMDGTCTWPETYKTCPWDCQPPYAASLTLDSTADCTYNWLYKDNESDNITVTVRDQYGNPLPDTQVKIYPENLAEFPDDIVGHITSYTVNPPIATTNSSGVATATFTWHACNCCFPQYMCGFGAIFEYAAIAGQAYGHDRSCAIIDGQAIRDYSLHCCPNY